MPGKIDEAAIWARVAPEKGAPVMGRQLRALLEEAMTRRREYRRLNLRGPDGEAETLRGLIYFYTGELPQAATKGLEPLPRLPAMKRLMELELQARGRYLALMESLQEPERTVLQGLARDAGDRWEKLLLQAGKQPDAGGR